MTMAAETGVIVAIGDDAFLYVRIPAGRALGTSFPDFGFQ
jgi:hypothetical protein